MVFCDTYLELFLFCQQLQMTNQQMLRGGGGVNAMQMSGPMTKLKQQITSLQNQIATQQAVYVKQQQAAGQGGVGLGGPGGPGGGIGPVGLGQMGGVGGPGGLAIGNVGVGGLGGLGGLGQLGGHLGGGGGGMGGMVGGGGGGGGANNDYLRGGQHDPNSLPLAFVDMQMQMGKVGGTDFCSCAG